MAEVKQRPLSRSIACFAASRGALGLTAATSPERCAALLLGGWLPVLASGMMACCAGGVGWCCWGDTWLVGSCMGSAGCCTIVPSTYLVGRGHAQGVGYSVHALLDHVDVCFGANVR